MSWLRISASEALTLLAQDDAMVFDVRDSAAYQAGHLAKAANLAMERIPAWSKRLNKDAPVLVYCYHGNSSQEYAQMLADFRFNRVYSVDGGFAALLDAGAALA